MFYNCTFATNNFFCTNESIMATALWLVQTMDENNYEKFKNKALKIAS